MAGFRDFHDRTAVITGAGAGIGRATALALAARGARVVVADRNRDSAEETVAAIRTDGGIAEAFEVDVSDRARVEAMAAFAVERFGRVDILHNNAGVGLGGRFIDMEPGDIEWLLGVNLLGVVHGFEVFLPLMAAQGSGHVVSTASLAGLLPVPGTSVYCASKHAVVGLSLSVRAEMRCHNVGVSVLCPGLVRTDIIQHSRLRSRRADRFQKPGMVTMMKRFGVHVDVAAAAAVRAIERDKALVIVGRQAWVMWRLMRLAPGTMQYLMTRIYAKLQGPMAAQEKE